MKREYAQHLLKKTKEDYNKIAEDFSRTRGKPWPEVEFLVDDYLIPGERVLDLGCGNGRLLEPLKGKEIDYFGVDNSEELIEIAKKRYPSRVKFQVADALNLPFPNNYFDKIYSIAALHHVPSKEFRLQFLKEARRVLKPEGLLILTCWKFKSKRELYLILKYTILKVLGKSKLDHRDILEPWGKKIKRYYHCFSEKELAGLARKADFKIVKIGIARNERGSRNNIYLIAEK